MSGAQQLCRSRDQRPSQGLTARRQGAAQKLWVLGLQCAQPVPSSGSAVFGCTGDRLKQRLPTFQTSWATGWQPYLVLGWAWLSNALFSPSSPPKVVQSGGKNIELAVMRRDQPLKVNPRLLLLSQWSAPGDRQGSAGSRCCGFSTRQGSSQTGGKQACQG